MECYASVVKRQKSPKACSALHNGLLLIATFCCYYNDLLLIAFFAVTAEICGAESHLNTGFICLL